MCYHRDGLLLPSVTIFRDCLAEDKRSRRRDLILKPVKAVTVNIHSLQYSFCASLFCRAYTASFCVLYCNLYNNFLLLLLNYRMRVLCCMKTMDENRHCYNTRSFRNRKKLLKTCILIVCVQSG